MRNLRLIIGVVGASRNMDQKPRKVQKALLRLALEIGQEITVRQHILLTGGEPDSDRELVRDYAMNGAKYIGSVSKPGRIISVLRNKEGFNVDVKKVFKPSCRHLIIQTDLSDERNFIDGQVPDVLIAVGGGKGTLSEISCALLFDTPIVFTQQVSVNTLNDLKMVSRDELKEILDTVHEAFPQFNSEELTAKALAYIRASTGLHTAERAGDAVGKAIDVAGKRDSPNTNMLPSYRGFTNEHIEKYQKYSDKLAD